MKYVHSGFTLIELLIVVAIIAILAAIAVPNFLEAQTRSKVSRAASEMRTLAAALESYWVEHSKYPMDTRYIAPDSSGNDFTFWMHPIWSLSTPVAYITSFPKDPFWKGGPDLYYQFGSVPCGWIVASCGPDGDSLERGDIKERFHYPQPTFDLMFLAAVTYDPSNGTVSEGDVVRVRM